MDNMSDYEKRQSACMYSRQNLYTKISVFFENSCQDSDFIAETGLKFYIHDFLNSPIFEKIKVKKKVIFSKMKGFKNS